MSTKPRQVNRFVIAFKEKCLLVSYKKEELLLVSGMQHAIDNDWDSPTYGKLEMVFYLTGTQGLHGLQEFAINNRCGSYIRFWTLEN